MKVDPAVTLKQKGSFPEEEKKEEAPVHWKCTHGPNEKCLNCLALDPK